MNKDQFKDLAREVLVRYMPPQIAKKHMVKLDVYYANEGKMVDEIRSIEADISEDVRKEVIEWAKETRNEWTRNLDKS